MDAELLGLDEQPVMILTDRQTQTYIHTQGFVCICLFVSRCGHISMQSKKSTKINLLATMLSDVNRLASLKCAYSMVLRWWVWVYVPVRGVFSSNWVIIRTFISMYLD